MISTNKCGGCGSCVRNCPTFDATGEEQFSPRGKLYLLQIINRVEKDEELEKDLRRLIFQCTLCGRCEEMCESGASLLEIWYEQRARAFSAQPSEFPHLESLSRALGEVRNIYGIPMEDRAIHWLDELKDEMPELESRVYDNARTADTVFFIGCLMSFRGSQMDVLRSVFRILEKLGIDYMVLGAEEFCCGHPLDLMGDKEEAENLRRHNSSVIRDARAKRVITCCPGCLIQLRQHDIGNIEVLHHTEFFDKLLGSIPKYDQKEQIAYHDPCELHRILGVGEQPRSLLRKMNVVYREMELSCCGGGGLLRMTDPGLSETIIELRAKREAVKNSTIVTACPSCREQLLSVELRTRDIAELIGDSLEEYSK